MEMAGKNKCVLRLRYNISTADIPANTDASSNGAKAFPSQDIYLDAGGGNSNSILSLAINTDQ